MLQRLRDTAPVGGFTLGWLLGSLRERSFGIVMLLRAIGGMPPGLTTVAGLLLMIPACQMIAGLLAPSFPRRVAARHLPTRHLAALVQRAVPVLRYLETIFHRRWPTPIRGTKRLVGVVLLFLDATVLLIPIPMVHVVPDLVIALISRAQLEEDGLLLSIAIVAAVAVLAVVSVVVRRRSSVPDGSSASGNWSRRPPIA